MDCRSAHGVLIESLIVREPTPYSRWTVLQAFVARPLARGGVSRVVELMFAQHKRIGCSAASNCRPWRLAHTRIPGLLRRRALRRPRPRAVPRATANSKDADVTSAQGMISYRQHVAGVGDMLLVEHGADPAWWLDQRDEERWGMRSSRCRAGFKNVGRRRQPTNGDVMDASIRATGQCRLTCRLKSDGVR